MPSQFGFTVLAIAMNNAASTLNFMDHASAELNRYAKPHAGFDA